MDHLRTTANSIQQIEVPYYAEEEYDGGSFEGYPERRNLKSWDIRRGFWKDEGGAAAFMQEWLFFGLMTVVFGVKVNMKDFFLVTSQGKRVITTRVLPRYVREWLSRCERIPSGLLQDYFNLRDKTILHASHHNLSIAKIPSLDPVALSISVLIQNLTDAISFLKFLQGGLVQEETLVLKIHNWLHVTDPCLEQLMLKNGWCPQEVARVLRKDLPSTTVHYLSTLQRNFRGADHQLCSESQCLIDIVPEDTYETKHVTGACSCDHIALPMKQLRAIVDDNNIPIIVCTLGTSGQLEDLEVLKWNSDLEFIAFSHVGSDGLGNPSGNTLPECQVLELCKKVSSLRRGQAETQRTLVNNLESVTTPSLDLTASSPPTKYLFWIDSLCIPVGENFQHLRKKAILRMRDIYINAWAVLALDAELATFSGLNDVEENLARIFCSLWMRRCWTLQELASSKQCYVSFSDTFFDLTNNIKPRKDRWPTALLTNYDFDSTYHYLSKQFTEILDATSALSPFNNENENKAERFAHIWNSMTWRLAAREEDRYAVIAILLESDLEKVLSTKDIKERIRIILASQKFIPLSIFTLNCRRQRKVGYHWAPAEFSPTALDMRTPEWPGVGVFDGAGLNVSYRGIILHAPVKFAEFYVLKHPETNRWCMIHHQFPKEDPIKEGIVKDWSNHIACYIFDNGPSSGARLSLLTTTSDGVHVVKYDCMAAIVELSQESLPPSIDDLDARKTPGVGIGFAETYIPLVHAEKTRSDQQWRIC